MLDYTGLKAETYPGSTGASVDMPPSNWPTYGIITFESVSLTYPDTGVRALRNIYCCFRAYEKVGKIFSNIKDTVSPGSEAARRMFVQGLFLYGKFHWISHCHI